MKNLKHGVLRMCSLMARVLKIRPSCSDIHYKSDRILDMCRIMSVLLTGTLRSSPPFSV